MTNQKSNCCNAPFHLVAESEGTCYYVCDKCMRGCDPEDAPDLKQQIIDIIDQSHDKVMGTYDFDTIAQRVINLIKV